MKRTVIFIVSMVIAGVLTTMTGCKKDDDSAYQDKGNYGNSNITTSVLSVPTWTQSGISYYAQLAVPALTADVQSGGNVSVFFSDDNGSTWIALPFTAISGAGNYQMWYITSISSVKVYWSFEGLGVGNDPNTYFSATSEFKVVVTAPAG